MTDISWGLAAAYKNTGFGGGAPDAAGAEVEIYPDGTAEIRSSSAGLGQRLTTIVAQITAEELGLPFERRTAFYSHCPGHLQRDLQRGGGAGAKATDKAQMAVEGKVIICLH